MCNPRLGANFMKANAVDFSLTLAQYAVAGLNTPPPDAIVPPMFSMQPLVQAGFGEVENRLLDHFTGSGIAWDFRDALYP